MEAALRMARGLSDAHREIDLTAALWVLLGVDEAEALISRYGLSARLMDLELGDLMDVPGIGRSKAERLIAAFTLARLRQENGSDRVTVRTPGVAAAVFEERMRHLMVEELHAIYLDRRNRIIDVRTLTRGNDGFCIVDPRQIYKPAVGLRAVSVVMAHNHPSGDPEPSSQDIEITKRVAAAGRVLGIQLVDHIVIGGSDWTSLAQRGQLPAWTPTPVLMAKED